jgi:tetratricopeptide (TPR) repeat protein
MTWEAELRELEDRLQLQPAPTAWEEARRLCGSEDARAKSPLALRLYGLASVVCHEPDHPRFDQGRRLLEQAAAALKELGQSDELALARLHLARAEHREGRHDRELDLLREALAAARRFNDPYVMVRAFYALGLAHVEHGQLGEAEALLDKLDSVVRRKRPQEQWRWHHLRAGILAGTGEARLAARELASAWVLLEETARCDPAGWLSADASSLTELLERHHETTEGGS